jgi:catechol 2,3-dioxygenase-like lactoylglutathione lyase family enzyme
MMSIKISLSSVSIDDYDKALHFYTEVMGFVLKRDMPLGEGARWITVVSADRPDGVELFLEPNSEYTAMKTLKEALVADNKPFTAIQVDDVQAEYERMRGLGVEFTMEPTNMGMVKAAVLDDTCGNLIQIYEMTAE